MDSVVEVSGGRPRASAILASRNPLGVFAVILAAVAFVVLGLAVSMVGSAAVAMHELFGRPLVEIAFNELPPSISVYVIVIGVAWLAWLVALILGVIALVRLRCRICGVIALAISVATPILAIATWNVTSTIA